MPERGARVRLHPNECPVCARPAAAQDLAAVTALGPELAELVATNTPGWQPALGLCQECVAGFVEAREALKRVGAGARTILPTALRLGASERYRGEGVTIAFLDAGFYAHPDLVGPPNRILAYKDITDRRAHKSALLRPDESSWHGMMTSVVACGSGTLSQDLYRGLASAANLVLVKCGSVRRIPHESIRRGLKWVVRHRKRYGIRIVNVSCGGDYERSYLHDGLSRAAEWATREGILVCAAVGNLGHLPHHPVLPPASSPSVLTVGGLDDKNSVRFSGYEMYPSSYGPTLDGLQKPEVIAPGIWVAAPILPGSQTAAQAELLSLLAATPDARLGETLAGRPGIDPELDAAVSLQPALLRQRVQAKVRAGNVISGAYKHVDGTSFAAPIVSAVAAQMLAAHPRLTPAQLKRILVQTARRLPHVPAERQGFGVVDPRAAVQEAERTAAA